jgi:hypothetical protein
MNARLYSPYVGRFLAPDNYVQAPDNTQSFNRYSYCLNNPLKYTDPSGNYAFIDDLIAAVVGGTVNVCSNLIAGEVKDFWHGLSLFGVGAVAGEATLYGSPLAGAAVMGIGNSVINQGYVNGWDKIDGVTVCNDLAMSMAMSCVGASMGNAFAEPLKRLTSHITNQIVKETFVGSLSGAASGCVLGIAFELSKKDADWESVLRGGWNGCWQGWALGTIDGLGSGFQHRAIQNRKFEMQGEIPTGMERNSSQLTYEDILPIAQSKYPNKAGKIEMHHVDPKYMGGDPHGSTIGIDASYHQLITNEFRKNWGYGKGKLPLEQRQIIMKKVYEIYPLPNP